MLPKILLVTICVAVRIYIISGADFNVFNVFVCKTDEDVLASLPKIVSSLATIIIKQDETENNVLTAKTNDVIEYIKPKGVSSLFIITANTCRLSANILNKVGVKIMHPSLYMLKFGRIFPERYNVSAEGVVLAYADATHTSMDVHNTKSFYNQLNAEIERVQQQNQPVSRRSNHPSIRISEPIIRPPVSQPATRVKNTVSTWTSVPKTTTKYERTLQHGEGSSMKAPRAFSFESSWNYSAPPKIEPLPYPLTLGLPTKSVWAHNRVMRTLRDSSQPITPVVAPPLLYQLVNQFIAEQKPLSVDDYLIDEGGSNATPSQNLGWDFPNEQDRNKKSRTN